MKIAYLVLAHNNPRHLQRLIGALSSASSACFVHIDKKSRLEDFPGLEAQSVHVSRDRVPVYWADFSQVAAILILLRMALADRRGFDYFVLLSGVDYPLKPASSIEAFFADNQGKEFINMVPMPCEEAGKSISRLTVYQPSHGGSRAGTIARRALARLMYPRGRDYKRHLGGLSPYGGSEWWALSRDACDYVRQFVDREARVVNFFRNTVCPDESFFQTIIGNSPYKAKAQRNLTYTDWSAKAWSPAFLTDAHFDFLAADGPIRCDGIYGEGEVLFARKFSDDAEDLVRRLDRAMNARQGRPRPSGMLEAR